MRLVRTILALAVAISLAMLPLGLFRRRRDEMMGSVIRVTIIDVDLVLMRAVNIACP